MHACSFPAVVVLSQITVLLTHFRRPVDWALKKPTNYLSTHFSGRPVHHCSLWWHWRKKQKFGTLHDCACHPCARGHANLLCIVPILVYVLGASTSIPGPWFRYIPCAYACCAPHGVHSFLLSYHFSSTFSGVSRLYMNRSVEWIFTYQKW